MSFLNADLSNRCRTLFHFGNGYDAMTRLYMRASIQLHLSVIAHIFSCNNSAHLLFLLDIKYSVTSRPFLKWDKVYSYWSHFRITVRRWWLGNKTGRTNVSSSGLTQGRVSGSWPCPRRYSDLVWMGLCHLSLQTIPIFKGHFGR